MSGVNLNLGDGNMPHANSKRELYDEDDEDFVRDSWEDIIMLRVGPYNLEYDPTTKELTVTGNALMQIDCIGNPDALGDVVTATTVVFHHDE